MVIDDILVVADRHSWLASWAGPIVAFEDVDVAALARFPLALLAPGDNIYQAFCKRFLDWKRDGLLPDTDFIIGTYKSRFLWSPDYDGLVRHWVVHARSERLALPSERLAFAPVCLLKPKVPVTEDDDGFVFLGGRKWREIDLGIDAIVASGRKGRVITDFAPAADFPGIEMVRERIPKTEYLQVMARSRMVIVPLRLSPISHGHVEVVSAILLGRPVLVTAGCSCDDYVVHGRNGLLVRDNSLAAWTEAIAEADARFDELAAGARAMSPHFHAARYAQYMLDLCRHGTEFDLAAVDQPAPMEAR